EHTPAAGRRRAAWPGRAGCRARGRARPAGRPSAGGPAPRPPAQTRVASTSRTSAPRVRRTGFMEYRRRPAISFQLDVCRLDDWCPAGNLALPQSGGRWLAAPRLVWNVTADFRQPPTHVLVVEGPVEGVGEPIKDWLRRSLGRKQGPPGHGLEFRQSGFLRGRDIR